MAKDVYVDYLVSASASGWLLLGDGGAAVRDGGAGGVDGSGDNGGAMTTTSSTAMDARCWGAGMLRCCNAAVLRCYDAGRWIRGLMQPLLRRISSTLFGLHSKEI